MSKQSPELLQALIKKGAVWRGRAQGAAREHGFVSTRIDRLDQQLGGGWPSHQGIELCVPTFAVEWLLLAKQLARVTNAGKIAVLINPPHGLMASKLLHDHIQLANLWVVETHNNADFVSSTVECLRTHSCETVAAWEPRGLQFVHLRKCMMACTDHPGLFFLVRNIFARRNASPATLRLMLKQQYTHVEVEIFKQKGLIEPTTLHFDLPASMLPKIPVKELGAKSSERAQVQRQHTNVVRLGRGADNRSSPDRF